MLLVPTQVKNSSIHGCGLYSTTFIKAGTVIWEFVEGFDLKFDPKTVAQLPVQIQDYLKIYAYAENGFIILTGDNDRFTNHSNTPNTKILDDGRVVAMSDIEIDHEITTNYFEFDEHASHKSITATH